MTTALEVDRPQWHEEAACSQTDPEVFFPRKHASTRVAKLICASCPVKRECSAWALGHDERYGVWGGMTANERRLIRRGQGLRLV